MRKYQIFILYFPEILYIMSRICGVLYSLVIEHSTHTVQISKTDIKYQGTIKNGRNTDKSIESQNVSILRRLLAI